MNQAYTPRADKWYRCDRFLFKAYVLECTVPWVAVCSQGCPAAAPPNFRTFFVTRERNPRCIKWSRPRQPPVCSLSLGLLGLDTRGKQGHSRGPARLACPSVRCSWVLLGASRDGHTGVCARLHSFSRLNDVPGVATVHLLVRLSVGGHSGRCGWRSLEHPCLGFCVDGRFRCQGPGLPGGGSYGGPEFNLTSSRRPFCIPSSAVAESSHAASWSRVSLSPTITAS